MTARILIAFLLAISLTACASRLNPMNWFGNDTEERVAAEDTAPGVAPATDPRLLVGEVASVNVDRMPGGAIIRAVGLPGRQGYWQAELVPGARDGSTLTIEFRIVPPVTTTPEGTPRSREVLAALFLSEQDMEGISTIMVVGQMNRRSVRR